MIGFLLSQGVSVDTPDLAESTPLHCAAAVGEPEARYPRSATPSS